eukprot:TRINITY_DN23999_c0_g1_i1.p1 TRINITY_DN23999_c0_g1~~TRINITY_DN23999_c0_g1_i1.p1  ORF type:complete len:947 (+),score=172.74 TRINITY_DN23999_c0_g1_i1:156-2996(+)
MGDRQHSRSPRGGGGVRQGPRVWFRGTPSSGGGAAAGGRSSIGGAGPAPVPPTEDDGVSFWPSTTECLVGGGSGVPVAGFNVGGAGSVASSAVGGAGSVATVSSAVGGCGRDVHGTGFGAVRDAVSFAGSVASGAAPVDDRRFHGAGRVHDTWDTASFGTPGGGGCFHDAGLGAAGVGVIGGSCGSASSSACGAGPASVGLGAAPSPFRSQLRHLGRDADGGHAARPARHEEASYVAPWSFSRDPPTTHATGAGSATSAVTAAVPGQVVEPAAPASSVTGAPTRTSSKSHTVPGLTLPGLREPFPVSGPHTDASGAGPRKGFIQSLVGRFGSRSSNEAAAGCAAGSSGGGSSLDDRSRMWCDSDGVWHGYSNIGNNYPGGRSGGACASSHGGGAGRGGGGHDLDGVVDVSSSPSASADVDSSQCTACASGTLPFVAGNESSSAVRTPAILRPAEDWTPQTPATSENPPPYFSSLAPVQGGNVATSEPPCAGMPASTEPALVERRRAAVARAGWSHGDPWIYIHGGEDLTEYVVGSGGAGGSSGGGCVGGSVGGGGGGIPTPLGKREFGVQCESQGLADEQEASIRAPVSRQAPTRLLDVIRAFGTAPADAAAAAAAATAAQAEGHGSCGGGRDGSLRDGGSATNAGVGTHQAGVDRVSGRRSSTFPVVQYPATTGTSSSTAPLPRRGSMALRPGSTGTLAVALTVAVHEELDAVSAGWGLTQGDEQAVDPARVHTMAAEKALFAAMNRIARRAETRALKWVLAPPSGDAGAGGPFLASAVATQRRLEEKLSAADVRVQHLRRLLSTQRSLGDAEAEEADAPRLPMSQRHQQQADKRRRQSLLQQEQDAALLRRAALAGTSNRPRGGCGGGVHEATTFVPFTVEAEGILAQCAQRLILIDQWQQIVMPMLEARIEEAVDRRRELAGLAFHHLPGKALGPQRALHLLP